VCTVTRWQWYESAGSGRAASNVAHMAPLGTGSGLKGLGEQVPLLAPADLVELGQHCEEVFATSATPAAWTTSPLDPRTTRR
jgi:hypothetical protein